MKKLISFSLFIAIVMIAWAASIVSANAQGLHRMRPSFRAEIVAPAPLVGRGYWKWNRRAKQHKLVKHAR